MSSATSRPVGAIVIPARAASTRMREKLLRDDSGTPLIIHTLERAEEARRDPGTLIQHVLVATDDRRIASAVEAAGGRAVMTDTDLPTGTDRIAAAALELPAQVELVVNLQGDEPEIEVVDIALAAQALASNPRADIGTLCTPIVSHEELRAPSAVKVVFDEHGRALYFSRSPIPHDRDGTLGEGQVLGYRHLGIYAYRREALTRFVGLPSPEIERLEKLEQLRALAHGMTIAVAVTHSPARRGIDTEEDYQAFLRRLERRRDGGGATS